MRQDGGMGTLEKFGLQWIDVLMELNEKNILDLMEMMKQLGRELSNMHLVKKVMMNSCCCVCF